MIGNIGGAGPLASALLYELVIEEHYRRTQEGQLCPLPEILLFNHAFTRGLTLEESTANHTCLASELEACIRQLRKAGATRICLACNTLHSLLPRPLSPDFIHLPQRVIAALHQQKVVKAGVLSTETTKQAGLYSDPAIEFVYPSEEEQRLINSVLDRILEGRIQDSDRRCVQKIMQNMRVRHGSTAFVLGCTDLPVLHRRYPLQTAGICVFDSIRILAEEILGAIK